MLGVGGIEINREILHKNPGLEHLIHRSLTKRVQIILSGRKGRKGAGRKEGFINLFSGLCRCEVCKKGVVIRRAYGSASAARRSSRAAA